MAQISIIVPVFKVEPFLRRCIDSILAQTFTDFELILVDDGSPDNCPAICDEYARKDKRVLVIHQENSGLSSARNAGIDWVFENSNSEWITFIDSDDWIHPKTLEVLYSSAVEHKLNISVCNFIRTRNEEQDVNIEISAKLYSPELLYTEQPVVSIIACAKLYKKSCFEEVRYPIGKIHEDEFTTYKILFKELRVSFIETPLYYYYINPNGITKSEWNVKKLDVVNAINEQILYFKQNNFHDAEKFALYKFGIVLANNIYDAKASDSYVENNKTIKNLEKELRRSLRKNKKLFPKKENKWMYQIAYPEINQLYWLLYGIVKKFKRG